MFTAFQDISESTSINLLMSFDRPFVIIQSSYPVFAEEDWVRSVKFWAFAYDSENTGKWEAKYDTAIFHVYPACKFPRV